MKFLSRMIAFEEFATICVHSRLKNLHLSVPGVPRVLLPGTIRKHKSPSSAGHPGVRRAGL